MRKTSLHQCVTGTDMTKSNIEESNEIKKILQSKEVLNEKHRRCTDILFLLFISSAWLAMAGVGLAATGYIESEHIPKGDPRRLTHGMDYDGNICGVSNVIVKSDGIMKNIVDLPNAYYLPSGLPVCISKCPDEDNFEKFHCKYDLDINDLTVEDGLQYTITLKCMPYVKSKSFLGYCSPEEGMDYIAETTLDAVREIEDDPSLNATFVDPKSFDEETKFFEDSLADLKTSRDVILGFGFGVSIFLGFLFLFLLRVPGILYLVIWSFIGLVFAGLVACSYYMRRTSDRWDEEEIREEREVTGLLVLSYIVAALAIGWFVIVCWMRKRIILAIDCIKEASKAVGKIPIIVFYPVAQAFWSFGFLIVWAIIMIYLAASGDMVPQCICPSSTDVTEIFETNYNVDDENAICQTDCFLFKSFEYTTNTKYAGLYMLFVWFWTSQFIVAVGEIAIGKNDERILFKSYEAFAQLCFDYYISHVHINLFLHKREEVRR